LLKDLEWVGKLGKIGKACELGRIRGLLFVLINDLAAFRPKIGLNRINQCAVGCKKENSKKKGYGLLKCNIHGIV